MHKPCVGECVHSFLTRMRTRTHSRAQNIKMKGFGAKKFPPISKLFKR